MTSSLIEGILGLIFRCIIGILCFYTGEIIISILTAGKKKPRWDYSPDASVTKFYVLAEISTWIGFVFWIFTIGFIVSVMI